MPSTKELPSQVWLAVGIVGLVGSALILLFTDGISAQLVWLAENYRVAAPALSSDRIDEVRQGVRLWAWSSIIVGAVALPLGTHYLRSFLGAAFVWSSNRITRPISLLPDSYGGAFLLATGGVLVFTALTHWSLTAYKDVGWFGGEDGASEWWSVATYLVAAFLAGATAWRLRNAGHPLLASLHWVLSAVLLVGALEEISWGQRIFDWGTPETLATVNAQGETTIHNLGNVDSAIFSLFFWGSLAALAGGALRAVWHRSGRVTLADFVLPSLVVSPALLMILVWRIGSDWTAVNLPRLVMESFDFGPQGSEVPEALLGLCVCVYTFSNLRRAMALPETGRAAPRANTTKQTENRNSLISLG